MCECICHALFCLILLISLKVIWGSLYITIMPLAIGLFNKIY